jgi:hypothetical protein
MVSHSEIALENSLEQPAVPKSRKSRLRSSTAQKKAKRKSSGKITNPAEETQPSGTDIVPIMKLSDIGFVENAKNENDVKNEPSATDEETSQAIKMPPPEDSLELLTESVGTTASDKDANEPFAIPTDENGEQLVTDPELLELLEQLSVTIDTANNVLDSTSTLPGDGEEVGQEQVEASEQKPVPIPEQTPEPAPVPEQEREELPLAARLAPEPAPTPHKSRVGLGLLANTALTGLVFAAGAAWLMHTNPWLLEGETLATTKPEAPVAKPVAKGQITQQIKKVAPVIVATKPSPVLASFSPPDDDVAPMETVTPPAPQPVAAPIKPAQGPAGQPISLNITLPANAGPDEISVMIQGVPNKAKLSAGKDLGSGNWLLSESQLEDVSLTTGKKFKPGKYELEVILVRSDGKVPETRKVSVAVVPANVGPVSLEPLADKPVGKTQITDVKPDAAMQKTTMAKTGVGIQIPSTPAKQAPAPQAATIQLTKQEVGTLLTRGDTLLLEGDVAGARLLLEYAANSGSKQAMVKLGNSYDPKHLDKLGVRGVQPDEAQAVHWYERAAK